MKGTWCFLLCLLCIAAKAHLPAAQIKPGKMNYLNPQSCWWVDSSGTYPMAGVWQKPDLHLANARFRNVENLGTTSYAYFQRFTFVEPANSTLHFTIENMVIDTVEVWYTFRGQLIKRMFGGKMPLPPNAEKSGNYTLRLFTDGTHQQVLVRYRHKSLLLVPTFISDSVGFNRHTATRYAVEFFLLGILVALAGYNILQLFINESNEYLFYIGYFFCLLLFVYLFFFGYANLIPDQLRYWVYDKGYFFGAALCYLVLGFSKKHVRQAYVSRGMAVLMKIFITMATIVLLGCFVAPSDVAIAALQCLSALLVFFHPVYVGSALKKGDRYMQLYFYSSLVICLGSQVYSLMLLDILSLDWISHNYLLPVTACLEMICLTLSLAYRSLQDRRDKERLKSKMLHMVENRKQELETEVTLQTAALRKAVKELEQTGEVKSKLLSIISHDLRLPFVTLNGTLELLQRGMLPPDKVQQKVQHISSSIRQISLTLENLLTWSKSQQRKISTHPEPVHLLSIVENCTNLLHEPMKGKELRLEVVVDENLYVLADSFQLECVLRNLLSNAIKASPGGGSLAVKGNRNPDGLCRISIKDQGKGIEAPSLSDLLRTDAPLKPYSLSNGLGLQICREFLANHDSLLFYYHDQGGTCFYFDLPFSSARQAVVV